MLNNEFPQGTTSNNFHFTTIHKMHYLLVQTSPNNLLTYFAMFSELTIIHLAIKINLLQLRNTHISNILSKVHIILGLPHMLTS